MNIFSQLLGKLEQNQILNNCILNKKNAMAVGLPSVNKANLILGIYEQSKEKLVLVLTPDEQSSQALCSDFNAFAGDDIAEVFPYRDLVLRPIESSSNEYEIERMGVLFRILSKKTRVVFCSISSACLYTMPQNILERSVISIKSGQNFDQSEFIRMISEIGYIKRDQIDGTGQFAVRGAIVDIYPASTKTPVRIEYWGDDIDSICFFDLETQRRSEQVDVLEICPVSEFILNKAEFVDSVKEIIDSDITLNAKLKIESDLEKIQHGASISNIDKYISVVYNDKVTILDYFADGILLVSEQKAVEKALADENNQWAEDLDILFDEGELCIPLKNVRPDFTDVLSNIYKNVLFLENFPHKADTCKLDEIISFNAINLGNWSGERKVLVEELEFYNEKDFTVIIMAGTNKAADMLSKDLLAVGIVAPVVEYSHEIQSKGVYITSGAISSGFEYPDAKFAVISVNKFKYRDSGNRKKSLKGQIRSLSDLNIGDLVVHVSYGIGSFEGIEKISVRDIEKDYIKIKYAGTNVLYVPVTQLDLVSKYMGSDEGRVKLNKLGTDDWKRTKRRVKKEAKQMAKELIELYAKRQNTKGFAFSPDGDWMVNFERHFEYEETQDQLTAIEDIKHDMESTKPMDRLLCGDVGFGKTEVALRAAFKCVLDGKQCAFLCPTTILAWQHYRTLIERLGDFPVNVELLSRFKTSKQQKDIINKLKIGSVDIIVGTHRLVQKDIEFKDLGLAIIDEEQRFGVSQKEKFKQLFNGIDILSLSATPIPRTLNMAMSGIRDMSVLEEPPQDRQPIQTYVMEYEPLVIAEAIRKELRRNGQVYYIHNRISTITHCKTKIQRLVPDAKIGVAHGQMGEKELSLVWEQVLNHDIDILICTTIIETGVDIANANTMIVEHADYMGLSQLYQLRGRIGRAKRRAFAYFTFNRGKVLSDIATKRLSAIREFTRFGSGFRIALRDLEIRGAGSLLGERQHGQMETVGYDMYIRILNEAVCEAQGKKPEKEFVDCAIDIPISAHIPEKYISNISQRLEIYRKIAALENEEDKIDLIDELIDRFGEPAKSVIGLMDVAILRSKAAKLGFNEIIADGVALKFYPAKLEIEKMADIVDKLKGRASLNVGEKPYLSVKVQKDSFLDVIKLVLE